ncbi:MAG: hypothetical protein AAGA96_18710 [Verrucomicrobiota bacterium]
MRFIIVAFVIAGFPVASFAWDFASGGAIGGTFVSFDFETKQLTFQDPISASSQVIPSRQLSFRSKQKLVFSPVFHRSFPDSPFWSPERRKMLHILSLFTTLPLFLGFWISSRLIVSKSNPVLALAAFAGSWLVGAIFVFSYFLLHERFSGSPVYLLMGFLVGATFLSIFISAIYGCSIFKGAALFVVHLFAGFCVAGLLFFLSEVVILPTAKTTLWHDHIFVPVGILKAW